MNIIENISTNTNNIQTEKPLLTRKIGYGIYELFQKKETSSKDILKCIHCNTLIVRSNFGTHRKTKYHKFNTKQLNHNEKCNDKNDTDSDTNEDIDENNKITIDTRFNFNDLDNYEKNFFNILVERFKHPECERDRILYKQLNDFIRGYTKINRMTKISIYKEYADILDDIENNTY